MHILLSARLPALGEVGLYGGVLRLVEVVVDIVIAPISPHHSCTIVATDAKTTGLSSGEGDRASASIATGGSSGGASPPARPPPKPSSPKPDVKPDVKPPDVKPQDVKPQDVIPPPLPDAPVPASVSVLSVQTTAQTAPLGLQTPLSRPGKAR